MSLEAKRLSLSIELKPAISQKGKALFCYLLGCSFGSRAKVILFFIMYADYYKLLPFYNTDVTVSGYLFGFQTIFFPFFKIGLFYFFVTSLNFYYGLLY